MLLFDPLCVALGYVDGLVQNFRDEERKADQSDVIGKGPGGFGESLDLG